MIEASLLNEKLKRSFGLYNDLIKELVDHNLKKDLAGLPSNTIGQQLWCVVGARESYLKAIISNGWQGFACSITRENVHKREAVEAQLADSSQKFLTAMEKLTSLTTVQQSLLFDLIEHEAQHHGQLVRYLYGQKLPIPTSWKKRYNLN